VQRWDRTELLGIARRIRVPVIIHIHFHPEADLVQVVQALGHPGALFGFAQRGEKHPRQDRDDGDDDEQLDQGETDTRFRVHFPRLL